MQIDCKLARNQACFHLLGDRHDLDERDEPDVLGDHGLVLPPCACLADQQQHGRDLLRRLPGYARDLEQSLSGGAERHGLQGGLSFSKRALPPEIARR